MTLQQLRIELLNNRSKLMRNAYVGCLPVSNHFASQMNNEIAANLWSSIDRPKQDMAPAAGWRRTVLWANLILYAESDSKIA